MHLTFAHKSRVHFINDLLLLVRLLMFQTHQNLSILQLMRHNEVLTIDHKDILKGCPSLPLIALQRFLSHGRKEGSFTKEEEGKTGGRKDWSSAQHVMICTHSIQSCGFIYH